MAGLLLVFPTGKDLGKQALDRAADRLVKDLLPDAVAHDVTLLLLAVPQPADRGGGAVPGSS
ncbi:hypothetical protein [Streptomyces cinerochromogenes]|uniref:hypothetical protein n=1 Tax=Streptomyces cinerochromogenes TaxID=66422 RepID=UPI0033AEB582